MENRKLKEQRVFNCCICGVELIRQGDMRYKHTIYPEEMLCPKHNAYVAGIMDAFQSPPHSKSDWDSPGGWADFIRNNEWILSDTERGK